jgi:hypothetical protein
MRIWIEFNGNFLGSLVECFGWIVSISSLFILCNIEWWIGINLGFLSIMASHDWKKE